MTTTRKRHLKSKFALIQASSILFHFIWICKILANCTGLNPKGPYLSLVKRKENSCVGFTNSIRRAREIRKFQVADLQRRLRNVQKALVWEQVYSRGKFVLKASHWSRNVHWDIVVVKIFGGKFATWSDGNYRGLKFSPIGANMKTRLESKIVCNSHKQAVLLTLYYDICSRTTWCTCKVVVSLM